MNETHGFRSRVPGYVARVEQTLNEYLPDAEEPPTALHRAMRYAILGNGKRIRPLLCYATGEVLGVAADRLDEAACAVELIHGYSLVHDDLPVMDDDALRRGRPTVHKAFGTATAILAGDALQTAAFGALARGTSDPTCRIRMLRTLSDAAGSRGMAGGQAMDLEATGQGASLAALNELDRRKTGCLIRASILMACDALADPNDADRHQLALFAEAIGVAFQIRDDLLDVDGDEKRTGKHAGTDASRHKSTWPALLGVQAARDQAQGAHDEARQALHHFGAAAAPLRWMADYIVQRDR